MSLLILIIIDLSIPGNFYLHPVRQGVYDRRTDTMKSAAGLIGIIIEFSACMKRGENHTFRRHAFFVHLHRDSPSVILYGTGPIRLQRYCDLRTESSQVLVHRVVDDFIYQMV